MVWPFAFILMIQGQKLKFSLKCLIYVGFFLRVSSRNVDIFSLLGVLKSLKRERKRIFLIYHMVSFFLELSIEKKKSLKCLKHLNVSFPHFKSSFFHFASSARQKNLFCLLIFFFFSLIFLKILPLPPLISPYPA